ncbi:hypothetical protein ABER75_04970 [Niallia taxi]|nr:hypothetical protein [Niallia taxi]MCM3214406.1 hypothetical protein [Niallia taxi]MDK8641186.1 hypothetical protein [Niallia taxi]MED4052554.1 hypothetical protein [Niallia taxi]MED4119909.1 hypothetical protein [Niallia taxi]
MGLIEKLQKKIIETDWTVLIEEEEMEVQEGADDKQNDNKDDLASS